MTFNSFLQKPSSKKIVTFEIDRGVDYSGELWIKFESNIYVNKYSNESIEDSFGYGYGAYGYGSYGLGQNTTLPEEYEGRKRASLIGSFYVNGEIYLNANSIDDLRLNEKSFFWDQINQLIYSNFESGLYPTAQEIKLGLTIGFTNVAGFYGGVFFESRIKNISPLETSKDPLYFGKVSFDAGTVTLNNLDGFFDNFDDLDVYGQKVRLKLGFDGMDYSDFQTVHTGFFDNFDNTESQTVVKIRDQRAALSRSIPINLFDSTTYPNISESNNDKVIPLGYGPVKNQLCYCLEESSEFEVEYTFKFVDTEFNTPQSLTKVYVDGVEKTPNTTTIANGEFTLLGWSGSGYTDYEPGQDVTATYEGYVNNNALEIIEDIMFNYASVAYTSINYDLTEWESVKAQVPNIGLSILEPKKIIDVIAEISSSINGIFLYNQSGLITFKLRDQNKASVATIDYSKYKTKLRIQNNPKEYTSSFRVQYYRDEEKKEFLNYVDKTQETRLNAKYGKLDEKKFETRLTNIPDVEEFTNSLILAYAGLFPTYTIKTPIEYINAEIQDNLTLDTKLRLSALSVFARTEIIKRSLNLNDFTIDFTTRFLTKDVDENSTLIMWDSNPENIYQWDSTPDIIINRSKEV